ncbi:MAG: erg26, C-3 sterol dehydrogenase [Geoglossum umbratile]|nr:MAG: erg26, C-3 sterol dehydrogenase [Geoglossum umbratile]
MAAPNTPTLGSVAVIGGCGMLGHHIVTLLHQRHPLSQISVLDIRTTGNRHASPSIRYFDCDITSREAVLAVFQAIGPDVVIHTASPTLMGGSKEIFEKVNVGGTRCLLDVSAEVGVKAFVYTSSASVVSDSVSDLVNADERWPCVPKGFQEEAYSLTKMDAELLVLAANRGESGMLTTSLRPSGIFGEGDVQLVVRMYDAYKSGKTGFQLGDNNNLFDFTYVTNVAHAHLLAAVALLHTHKSKAVTPVERKVDGEAFFITNDQPTYFWDFSREVWKVAGDKTGTDVRVISKDIGLSIATIIEWMWWVLGKTPSLTRKQVRYSCMTRYYNIGKAKERLGYKPIVSLPDGIERTVKWIMETEAAENGKKS